ncbi:hypothetical protein GCM10010297_40960 [Streptomyces malachitofuscus]|nr:hypothetical protein GCM10010297_40960 [Streptomyces malachitofuscus]
MSGQAATEPRPSAQHHPRPTRRLTPVRHPDELDIHGPTAKAAQTLRRQEHARSAKPTTRTRLSAEHRRHPTRRLAVVRHPDELDIHGPVTKAAPSLRRQEHAMSGKPATEPSPSAQHHPRPTRRLTPVRHPDELDIHGPTAKAAQTLRRQEHARSAKPTTRTRLSAEHRRHPTRRLAVVRHPDELDIHGPVTKAAPSLRRQEHAMSGKPATEPSPSAQLRPRPTRRRTPVRHPDGLVVEGGAEGQVLTRAPVGAGSTW